MADPMPARLLDNAPLRPTAHDDYVWHFVMHRAGQPPARGERLASLVLAPRDVAGYGLAELVRTGTDEATPPSARRQLAAGLDVLGRAIEAERREWVRKLIRAGYADGWGVAVVAERGRRRSAFSGIPSLADRRLVIHGGTTQ